MISFKLKSSLAILALAFFFNIGQTSAQSQNHEVGLRLHGLNDLDLIYKKQKGENKYRRYRLMSGVLNFALTHHATAGSFSAGLAMGTEKRESLNANFSFIHGWEPALQVGFHFNQNKSQVRVSPALGYVLGFQYDVNSRFYINLETIPALSTHLVYSSDGFSALNLNAGFNSTAVALTLAYRFTTE